MPVASKKVLILVCALALTIPLHAQDEVNHNQEIKPSIEAETPQDEHLTQTHTTVPPKKKTTNAFFDFINKKAYAAKIDEKEEKKILRESWKKLLGIDIFYPYFKAKEVEDWVSDKASVEIFKLRGRPKFENNQIIYTLKVKF